MNKRDHRNSNRSRAPHTISILTIARAKARGSGSVFFGALIALVVLATPLTNQGQTGAQEPAMPTAEAVLDRFVEVTGGKEAYEKLKNRTSSGTFENLLLNLKGKITSVQAEPNKMYSIMESDALGKIEQGSDGKVIWQRNATIGPRLVEDDDKILYERMFAFSPELHWRKLYKKAELVGVETIDGKPAYKVQLTTPQDTGVTMFFEKESGLRLRVILEVKTVSEKASVEQNLGDYRRVDGILLPFKTNQKVGQFEQVVTLDKVEHNVGLPADRFDLPADVKALAEQKKSP